MATFAYVFPPLSGLIAYFAGSDERARLHGLQAILLGILWPASLWVLSWVSVAATQIAFLLWVLVWLLLLIASAFGRDLTVPGVGKRLRGFAEPDPRG